MQHDSALCDMDQICVAAHSDTQVVEYLNCPPRRGFLASDPSTQRCLCYANGPRLGTGDVSELRETAHLSDRFHLAGREASGGITFLA